MSRPIFSLLDELPKLAAPKSRKAKGLLDDALAYDEVISLCPEDVMAKNGAPQSSLRAKVSLMTLASL